MASKATLAACLLVLALAVVAPSAEAGTSDLAPVETQPTDRCAGLVCDAVNLACETVLRRPCVR